MAGGDYTAGSKYRRSLKNLRIGPAAYAGLLKGSSSGSDSKK